MTIRIIIILLFAAPVISQQLDSIDAGRFICSLLSEEPIPVSWFDENTMATSRRLGIEYDGADAKPMIGYDIEQQIRRVIHDGHCTYAFKLDSIGVNITRLVLSVGQPAAIKEYYFKRKKFVSPLDVLTQGWRVMDSDHFRFFISDTASFNSYCPEQLESFLSRMAGILGLTDRDLQTLRENKIYYYLCRDEDEILRLTGYRVRGMYNLAYDAIVSTFATHEHELAHLLINFSLRRLPLYTHPLLQEGFAVASGGRGGLGPAVLAGLGEFLWRAQLVDFPPLLIKSDFDAIDPSLSYPASGMYVGYLIETLGRDRFLSLYRSHCGAADSPGVAALSPDELPAAGNWSSYIHNTRFDKLVTPGVDSVAAPVIYRGPGLLISADSSRYYFRSTAIAVLPGRISIGGYKSRTFRENLPDSTYLDGKYLIHATGDAVSVYNLYTNTLIASLSSSFSISPAPIPRLGDLYCYSIAKCVFDEPIETLLQSTKSCREQ